MATAISGGGQFDFGRVLNRGFGIIGREPVLFLALAVCSIVPAMAFQLLIPSFSTAADIAGLTRYLERFAGVIGLGVMVGGLFMLFVRAALFKLGTLLAQGQRAETGVILGRGASATFPLLLMAIVAGFGFLLGFLLLVVPGLILFTVWAVAEPVLIEERAGIFGSLGRSAALTRGHRWAIFGLLVLYAVVGMFLNGFAATLQIGLGADAVAPRMISAGVAGLVAVAWVAIKSSLYVELRDLHNGAAPDTLAEIFA